MKIEIKSRYTNGVLFAHEQENNTVRITLELAITSNTYLSGTNLRDADLSGVNLRGTNLRDADLSGVNLRGANLRDADLSGVNLRGVNLRGVNLRGANLSGADLSGADLSDADLSGADLSGASLLCTGDMHRIFTIQLDTWRIGFTKDTLQIGCQRHLIEKWKTFDDETINKMDDKALEWWSKWKDHIFKTIELCFGEER